MKHRRPRLDSAGGHDREHRRNDPRQRARPRREEIRHQSPRRQDGDRAEFRETPQHGGDLIFGAEPIRELAASAPSSVRVLYLRAGDNRRFAEEAMRVREAGGKVVEADDAALQRMAGSAARHQGVVALIREYTYAPLEQALAANPDPLLLIDGVMDPRNLGAILRSAEGAGVDTIVIAKDRTVGVTPAAVKASAGAWTHLRIARCGNVARALNDLKQRGYWIAALAPGGETSLYDLDPSRRLALVIGSEDRGIRDLVRKTADFVVGIPMLGKVKSLNVSVATAVALYEIARRRSAAAPG